MHLGLRKACRANNKMLNELTADISCTSKEEGDKTCWGFLGFFFHLRSQRTQSPLLKHSVA